MYKNKNQIEIGEQRVIEMTGFLQKLKERIKTHESKFPEEVNKLDFEKRKDEEKTAEGTFAESKEALKRLEEYTKAKEEILKSSQTGRDELLNEVEGILNDNDELLEKKEVEQIHEKIKKLVEQIEAPAESTSEDLLKELGVENKTELPEKFAWMKEAKPGKDFLELAKKIVDSNKEIKAGIDAMLEKAENTGLKINRTAFLGRIYELAATYAKQNYSKEQLTDTAKAASRLGNSQWFGGGWEKNKIMIFLSDPFDLTKASNIKNALVGIKDELEAQLEKLDKAAEDSDIKKYIEENPEAIGKALQTLGVGNASGEIQPRVIEYLLAGNNLQENLKKVIVVEEWKKAEPQLDASASRLGIRIDKEAKIAFLQKLGGKESKDLSAFQERTDALIGAIHKLDKASGGKNIGTPRIGRIEIAGTVLIEENKLLLGNFVGLRAETVTTLQKQVETLTEKIKTLAKVAKEGEAVLSEKLARFGGKIDSGALSKIITAKIFEAVTVGELLEDPKLIEDPILSVAKKKWGIEVSKIEEIPKKIDEKIDAFLGNIERKLVEKLSAKDFAIDGIELKLSKADLEKILPDVKKQILPLLSEFFEQSNEYGAEGKKLLENGIVNFDVLKDIEKNDKMKTILKSCETVAKIPEDQRKAEVEKLLKDEDAGAMATVGLTKEIGDFLLEETDPSPAVKAIQDEVASVIPLDVKMKLGFEKLTNAWNKVMEKFDGKNWGEAIGMIFSLVIPTVMKLVNGLTGWWKGLGEKVVKTVGPFAEKFMDSVPEKWRKHIPDSIKKLDKESRIEKLSSIGKFLNIQKREDYLKIQSLITIKVDDLLMTELNEQYIKNNEIAISLPQLKKLQEKLKTKTIGDKEKDQSVLNFLLNKIKTPNYLQPDA